jgi:hypothetical protein
MRLSLSSALETGKLKRKDTAQDDFTAKLTLWQHLDSSGLGHCKCKKSDFFLPSCTDWQPVPILTAKMNDGATQHLALLRDGGHGIRYKIDVPDFVKSWSDLRMSLAIGAECNYIYNHDSSIDAIQLATAAFDYSTIGKAARGVEPGIITLKIGLPAKPGERAPNMYEKRVPRPPKGPKATAQETYAGHAVFNFGAQLVFTGKQSKRLRPMRFDNAADNDAGLPSSRLRRASSTTTHFNIAHVEVLAVQVEHVIRTGVLNHTPDILEQLTRLLPNITLPGADALEKLGVSLRAIQRSGITLSRAQTAKRAREQEENAISLDESDDETSAPAGPSNKTQSKEKASSSTEVPAPPVSAPGALPHLDSVKGLAATLEHVESSHAAALVWCAAKDVDDVMQIVIANGVDAFVAALGIKAGGFKDKIVRSRLAALTKA